MLFIVRAARAYGAFDNLHGSPDGATFANAIRQATTVHYGHAGRAFLERLETQDNRDWSANFERTKALPIFSQAAEGQAKRVSARFALYGMAGELATEYGLTGWPPGDAAKAAGEYFRLWLDERGHRNDEKRKIIEQVCGFIDRHGDARFSNAKERPSDRSSIIRDRAGWWQDTDDRRVYLFSSEGMREALKGNDFSSGLDALQAAGMLPAPNPRGKHLKSKRITGRKGTVNVYPITIPAEITEPPESHLEVSVGGVGGFRGTPPGHGGNSSHPQGDRPITPDAPSRTALLQQDAHDYVIAKQGG